MHQTVTGFSTLECTPFLRRDQVLYKRGHHSLHVHTLHTDWRPFVLLVSSIRSKSSGSSVLKWCIGETTRGSLQTRSCGWDQALGRSRGWTETASWGKTGGCSQSNTWDFGPFWQLQEELHPSLVAAGQGLGQAKQAEGPRQPAALGHHPQNGPGRRTPQRLAGF